MYLANQSTHGKDLLRKINAKRDKKSLKGVRFQIAASRDRKQERDQSLSSTDELCLLAHTVKGNEEVCKGRSWLEPFIGAQK